MKEKYCLVRTDAPLGVNSFVYQVWVGSTDPELQKLLLVQEYCKDVGWYFKKWSRNVDSALEKRSKLTRVDGTRCVTPYRMIRITIKECYQHIIDDSFSALESNSVMTPQETAWRFRYNPAFLQRKHAQKCNTPCPPQRRKYLSHSQGKGFYNVGLNLTLAILLLILDAIVTNILGLS